MKGVRIETLPDDFYCEVVWLLHVNTKALAACAAQLPGARAGIGVTKLADGGYLLAILALDEGGFDEADTEQTNLLPAKLRPGLREIFPVILPGTES